MRVPFPEPGPSSDVPALFLTYLDYYRDTVADRVAGLTDAQARTARVPSGWTPVELLKHLAFMERRVLQEYARHAGHLDIVRELADGRTGE